MTAVKAAAPVCDEPNGWLVWAEDAEIMQLRFSSAI
jgi:hypothetical protein